MSCVWRMFLFGANFIIRVYLGEGRHLGYFLFKFKLKAKDSFFFSEAWRRVTGYRIPTFRGNMVSSSSKVEMSQKNSSKVDVAWKHWNLVYQWRSVNQKNGILRHTVAKTSKFDNLMIICLLIFSRHASARCRAMASLSDRNFMSTLRHNTVGMIPVDG